MLKYIRLLFSKWSCAHKWEVLSETTTESKFEHTAKTLSTLGMYEGKIPHQMCYADRKHIQIVVCKECGKLKRYVALI